MNQQWYYALNGEQQGPVSEDSIRTLVSNGTLDGKTTLLFSQGMKNWQPISEIDTFNKPQELSPGAPPINTSEDSTESKQYAFGEYPKSEVAPQTREPSNPYATPSSGLTPAPHHRRATGQEIQPGSEKLEIGSCITRAWELTKRHYGTLFLSGITFFAAFIVLGIISAIIQGPNAIPTPTPQSESLNFFEALEQAQGPQSTSDKVFQFISQLLSIFLTLGMTRIGLNIVKGEHASVGMIFGEGGKILNYFIASIFYFLILFIGLLLFIAPGIYLGLRLGLYQFAIVDKDLGPIEALKYSFKITNGNVANLFGLYLMIFLITLAGILAFLLGLLAAIPVAFLSTIVAYHYLTYGKNATLNDSQTQPTF